MIEPTCDRVQEAIPDLVEGRLAAEVAEAYGGHAASCAECGEILEVVRLLGAGRPVAPEGLAARIEGAVRFRRRSVARPWWGLAAAAIAAVALGIGVTSGPSPEVEVPTIAAEDAGASPWIAEDGMVAGAATFADLSDEALQTLLDEMNAPPTGGSA